MTAIAYKDGIMASDSLESRGGYRLGYVPKIWQRADGAVAGAAGDGICCQEFRKAFLDNREMGFRAELTEEAKKDGGGFSAIAAYPDGSLWEFFDNGCLQTHSKFTAVGSFDFLIGAMAAGATAKDAVWLAIAYDTNCGGDVNFLSLPSKGR